MVCGGVLYTLIIVLNCIFVFRIKLKDDLNKLNLSHEIVVFKLYWL